VSTATGESIPMTIDRVMVLIDGSQASRRAVRRAAALAATLRAAFVAIVVETTPTVQGSPASARNTQEIVDDAVDLGADVVHIEADDVGSGLAQAARARRATHVVIPFHDTGVLRRLLDRPLTDQLIERLPELEVHVVGAKPAPTR
jgi:K+-sensing histidine kinase KdpD